MNARKTVKTAITAMLLAVSVLSVTANRTLAAFNPGIMWTETVPSSMDIAWVDMGSHVDGYRSWDLVITLETTLQFPGAGNDWTNAHFELTTIAGSILQVDTDFDLPGEVVHQNLWPIFENLQWDTAAIGAPKSDGNYIVPWPADKYGTPEVVPGAVCNTSTINMDWYDYALEGPGTFHIFRLTVSDDWTGTWSGAVSDLLSSGAGDSFGQRPESIWNGTTGDWTDSARWSSNPLYPDNGNGGLSYHVATMNSGTVSLDQHIVISSLNLSGGALTGSYNLTLNEGGAWIGGTMSGSGTTINAGTLTISGTDGKFLDGRTLQNTGKVNWTGGTICSTGSAPVINNEDGGLFDAQADGTILSRNNSSDPGGTFNNVGTFLKSAGTGIATIDSPWVFNNTGTVEVRSGTLSIGSSGTASGAFKVLSDAKLDFGSDLAYQNLSGATIINDGTISISQSQVELGMALFSGTGKLDLCGGVAEFDSPTDIETRVALRAGSLSGTGQATFTQLTWTGGTMSGTGTTVNAGILTISGTNGKFLDGRTLQNTGKVNWTGGTLYSTGSAPLLNNEDGGVFDAQADGILLSRNNSSDPGGAFNNVGTFLKSAGTGTAIIDSPWVFNNTGTVEVRSGTLKFAGTFTQMGAGMTIVNEGCTLEGVDFSAHRIVNNGTIRSKGSMTLGDATTYDGYSGTGNLEAGSYTITLNSAGFITLPRLTTLSGGTIIASKGLALGMATNFVGLGNLNAKIAAGFASTIQATGDLSVGDSTSYAGFFSDGELYANNNTVRLMDKNEAVLGSLTVVGSAEGPGTISAANGLQLEFGKNIVGHGLIDTPNDATKPFVNNGAIEGDSMSDPIYLNGYIKGVGTLNNVIILGTDSPGFSPVKQMVGSKGWAEGALLIMELGGQMAGSQFDQIIASDTLLFGGTLEVALIDGYSPALGDKFDLFDWQAKTGEFDNLVLPALSSGLSWDATRINVDGSLSVVPEPAMLSLLILGGLTSLRRRRNDSIQTAPRR